MPVSPEMAARLTQDLRRVYEDAANQLIRSIAAQVGRGIQDATWQDRKLDALTALMREADAIIVDLRRQVPGAVEQALAYAYRRGGATAAADAETAGIQGGFNHMPDSEAISRLLSDAMRPHEAAIARIRRSVQDAYDAAVSKAAASMLTGSITRREAARQALTELARQGITGFTDRSGRNWDMAAYAEMATRTNTGHAAIQGHLDRLTGLGVDTVYCSDSPEECETCRPFEHQVLSVSGATTGRLSDGREVLMSVADAQQAGLFHPNCTHSLSIYLPSFTELEPSQAPDPDDYAERQRQRAYERRIRSWRRRVEVEEAALGKEAPEAKAARKRLREVNAEYTAWLEAHQRRRSPGRTNLTVR